jgi:mono/diheme cytochrome c family protein
MKARALLFVIAGVFAVARVAVAQQPAAATVLSSEAAARAVIDKYCVTCHNDRMKAGFANLSLQGIDLTEVSGSAAQLEKVVLKLRAGTMPPPNRPRPDAATYSALRHFIAKQLDEAALKHPNPGRTPSLHRLNGLEYANAIRDLLAVEGLNYSTLLPKDDASYGFDNIAGVLGLSPTHVDQYLNAARYVSRFAVGDVTLPPDGETRMVASDLSQDGRLEDMPFGTRGGTRLRRYFPVDATYTIRFQAFTGVGVSSKEPNYIEVTIDGERVFYEKMEQKKLLGMGTDGRLNTDWELELPIKAGLRDLEVTFLQTTNAEAEELLQPFMRPPGVSGFALSRLGGYAGPYLAQVSFTGPFTATGPGDTPSRHRIFTCQPTPGTEEQCARRILSTLARRAYRRPASTNDVEALVAFYRKGRSRGSFETGIQIALERLLASPDFLFRIEEDTPTANGQPHRISDVELASRLSFFLWSSIPDDDLLDVASKGLLKDQKVLDLQVQRMLKDPKAEAFTRNFAGQWLQLRAIPGIDRNAQLFPDFDDNLRQAMRRETELFFGSVVSENRSALDLLNADYTFLNDRLAKHYGVPNVSGSHFRRVQVEDPNRRGLLGQGSILMVTAQATRTSPVARGKWVLANLLGAPPPAPPPNVPPLEQTELKGTLRQRMETHRKNPVCASCHTMMDPIGFALENFDPIGQWRTKDEGYAVDAAGAMPDGTKIDGVNGLRDAILATPDAFVETLTDKLMVYALGRGTEYYDAPVIRRIARNAEQDDYRFSRLILGIVNSAAFQMRASAVVVGN